MSSHLLPQQKAKNAMKPRFPDWEELARLAATVSSGMKKSPAEAVAYALELYQESQAALERAAISEGGVAEYGLVGHQLDRTMERLDLLQKREKTVPKPAKFPATLADFFKVIVRAKTPADCTKRLRDFLCYTYQPNSSGQKATNENAITLASNQLQKMNDLDKQGGYFSEQVWQSFGGSYLDWWKIEKSTKARKSGSQRKRKRA